VTSVTVNSRVQVACAWGGIVGFAMIIVGTFVAGCVPAPHADSSAREIAQFYIDHENRIRVGLTIVLLSLFSWATLSAAISAQIARTESGPPVLAILQGIVAACNLTLFVLFTMFLLAAAFRPGEVPATTTQTLHDLGWFMVFLPVTTFMLQSATCSVAIFAAPDESVFPRWLGYFNVLVTLLLFPGVLLAFFKSGVLAYHGLLSFWFAFAAVSAWAFVMSWAVLRAVRAADHA